jgi:hypothetical protein
MIARYLVQGARGVMAGRRLLGAHEMGDLSIQFKATMSHPGAGYAVEREKEVAKE